MSMSMLVSVRTELRIRPLLSVQGRLICASCFEHGRESVLLLVRSRHRWFAVCLAPGCDDGISRDEVMTRPVRGCKGWTKGVWLVVGKKSLPPAVAAEFCDELSKNGRASQWAMNRLQELTPPPPVVRPRLDANGNGHAKKKGVRGGRRPKREKHRHKNHR